MVRRNISGTLVLCGFVLLSAAGECFADVEGGKSSIILLI